jgi:hypothetical protein
MDLIGILVFFLVVFIIAFLAHYVITTFLPDPIRMVALVVVGVILLIIIIQVLVGGGVHWPKGPVFKWGGTP